MFSPTITTFWDATFATGDTWDGAEGFTLAIHPDRDPLRPVEVLTYPDGTVAAAVSPAAAAALGISAGTSLDAVSFRERLSSAGLVLHDPDCLFYVTDEAASVLSRGTTPDHVRQLTSADAALFSRFQSNAPADDLEEAYVELDHWSVVGGFVDDELACVASAYPWRGAALADIGVLTLPGFRGRGLARDVVRSIGCTALAQGLSPQYRCQPANTGSRAVAAAAGFTYFGQWELVVDTPSGD
ncbi:GNAT family N-acetyltransferase [Arthrobacter sp.]|uniref:GNAT family N-acetyltransferase n=1 Tax=Arthrobacter sp. TaxID=1667 RepID=UPI003A90391C